MTSPDAAAIRSAVSYLDSWLAFRQQYLRIPGVQAAVYFQDDIVFSGAYGRADVEAGTAMTTRHLFRIASHSKTFTATAILQLAEAGSLRLDDRLGTHLAWLGENGLGDRTIREVLAHGGGITRDGVDSGFWTLTLPYPDEAGLRAIAADDAAILPANERFKYSNIGYSLLGAVIAAVSGEPYNAVVTRAIVDALQLPDTAPELIWDRLDDYAKGYSGLSYADKRIPIEHVDTRAMSAATGFTSTAEDVCRYFAAHFFGDERLISDASKRLMQRDEWQVEDDSWYGLGLSVQKIDDRRMVGHGGGYPGHSTRTLFDPEDRIVVSVLTNAIDGAAGELATGAVKLINLAATSADEPETAATERFCGRFANLWSVQDVVRLGGRLHNLSPTQPDPTTNKLELRVNSEDSLKIADGPGYGAPGELMRYDFAGDTVRSIRSGGGMTLHPYEEFRAAMAGREQITRP
ncbi:MAG TPA: serine hydrolase domain-containing protein [Mycobacteriales bacterium]|nr:serine hydrolase domain-containing protein [Mycobacteriales bacterium]